MKDGLEIVHREGVWWYEAPLPRRLHVCAPWTTNGEISRCACGGTSYDGVLWIERNSRHNKGDSQ